MQHGSQNATDRYEQQNLNIPRQKFRELASAIMLEVDKGNGMNRIKRIFSTNSLWRIKEIGAINALKKGFRILKPKTLTS